MDYEPGPDDEYKVLDRNEWLYGLFSVLDSRKTPIKKLHIVADIFEPDESDFYEFFRDVCAAGVEELSIEDTDIYSRYKIPSPIFACKTITKLEIDSCKLVVPSKLTGLRAVKTLVLSTVVVDEVDLRRMISRCKAMEKLVITDCLKIKNIVIRAPNLSKLVIDLCHPVGIVLENVPQLASVSVSFGYNFDEWKICYASFEEEKKFDIDEMIEEYRPNGETFEGTNEAPNLTRFLNGLSGVKNLRLKFSDECLGVSGLEFLGEATASRCVKHNLATATFYLGEDISEDCIVFPKFLLLNAGNLKSMNMLFYGRDPETISNTEEKIKNGILAIQMASPDVEIMIKPTNNRYPEF